MIQAVEKLDKTDESLKHNLQLISRTAHHMNALIGDLTDVAKMQAGRLNVERHECDVAEVVEPAIDTIGPLAAEKYIDFIPRIQSGLCLVSVDLLRMRQVLNNLLGNAVKFTPEGGQITLDVEDIRDEVRFTVRDNGPGIPGEALSHIFEPYWQVRKTRSGMGLGLFIAKTLVEAHGGRIWVESDLGHGTAFYFTLPAINRSKASVNQRVAS
jgi:signal transduction histidine kinase